MRSKAWSRPLAGYAARPSNHLFDRRRPECVDLAEAMYVDIQAPARREPRCGDERLQRLHVIAAAHEPGNADVQAFAVHGAASIARVAELIRINSRKSPRPDPPASRQYQT